MVGLVAALLAACTGSDEPAPAPPTSTADSAAQDWRWRQVGGVAPADYRGDWDADRQFLVNAATPRDRWPSLINRSTGESLLRIKPRPDYVLGSVLLDTPWLVWNESSEDLDIQPTDVIGHVVNVRTDEHHVLDGGRHPEPGLPDGWALHGGTVAYMTQADAGNCLVLLRLATWRSSLSRCTPGRQVGAGYPQLSRYGIAVSQFSPQPKPLGCVRILFARAGRVPGPDDYRPVRQRRNCDGFGGSVGRDFVAWQEQPNRQRPDVAQLFARPSGGVVRRLGESETGMAVVCRGWLYWSWDEGVLPELRRWRPGHEPETVYRAERPWLLMTGPRCQDDRITFARARLGPLRHTLVEALLPRS